MAAKKSHRAIQATRYRTLVASDLPRDLGDKLLAKLEMSNGTAKVVNPAYHADLAKWLEEQGEDPTECFLIWASW